MKAFQAWSRREGQRIKIRRGKEEGRYGKEKEIKKRV